MHALQTREFNPLKVLHHMPRLTALAEGRDIAPVTVEIDPVAYCNHRCGWCVDPVHRPVRMAPDTFKALIAELALFRVDGARVRGVVLKGGGEPTLHPDFDLFVRRPAELGFAVGVVSNGSRLAAHAAVLARHAAYVRVSIDGPTPESHALIHGSDDFEDVLVGARALVAARGAARHPVIGASFAIDARTVHLADEAIALGQRLGLDYVLLRPPFFEEVGAEPTMSVAEAAAVRAALRAAAARFTGGMLVQVGEWIGDAERHGTATELVASGRRASHRASLPVEHRTGRCLASPMLAVVTADGSVYGCCNLRALDDWCFGRLDFARGVGFAQVWAGRRRAEVLARMHATACIAHCTHPLSRYNEIIEALRIEGPAHVEFV